MFRKWLLAIATILPFAFLTQGAQALEPAVAFVGGYTMYGWQSSGVFGSTISNGIPVWLAQGFQDDASLGPCHETNQAQTVVANLLKNYPNIVAVHLLVGGDDTYSNDANPPAFVFNQFQGCFATLVNEVLDAHRKLVVGTIPVNSTIFNGTPFNDFIFAYCASKGVPVINYTDLLTHAQDNFEGVQYFVPPTNAQPFSTITNQGYALMNSLASIVLDQTLNGTTLKSGYLGVDSLQKVGDPPFVPAQGLNTVVPGTEMHWKPWGQYSDGTTIPIENANTDHVLGTWTSSNPLVVKIDPYGTAWALAPGTANIHFTTLSGKTINEWVMYVVPENHPN